MGRHRRRAPEEQCYDICRFSVQTNKIEARHEYSFQGLALAEMVARRLNERLSDEEGKRSRWNPYTPATMPLAPRTRRRLPRGKRDDYKGRGR